MLTDDVSLLIEGVSPDEHRRVYPARWTKKQRAWPIFWTGLLIVPVVAAANAIGGETWSTADSNFAGGWIAARFIIAMWPDSKDITTTWQLDRRTVWQRIKEYFSHAG